MHKHKGTFQKGFLPATVAKEKRQYAVQQAAAARGTRSLRKCSFFAFFFWFQKYDREVLIDMCTNLVQPSYSRHIYLQSSSLPVYHIMHCKTCPLLLTLYCRKLKCPEGEWNGRDGWNTDGSSPTTRRRSSRTAGQAFN